MPESAKGEGMRRRRRTVRRVVSSPGPLRAVMHTRFSDGPSETGTRWQTSWRQLLSKVERMLTSRCPLQVDLV